MREITEPPWMKEIHNKSFLGRLDILKLYGYSPKTCIQTLINKGQIPAPYKPEEVNTRYPTKYRPFKKLMWSVRDIRKLIRK